MFLTWIYLWFALPLLAGLFYLLAVAKILRDNVLLGLVMLIFWPAGIYAMVRYWGDPEGDIRGRMLPACVLFTAWIALLFADIHISPPHGTRSAATASRFPSGADDDNEIADQLRLTTAVAELPIRSGVAAIAPAKASVAIPTHFRFVERSALETLYAKLDNTLDPATVGWLVHESVNLADDDAWFIEVEWHADGYVAESAFASLSPSALLSDAQRAATGLAERGNGVDYRILRYAEDPQLDVDRHLVTWVEETVEADAAAHKVDCYAALLGRRGVLGFTISDMDPARQELCLRSVRLAAARTSFSGGENYADHSRWFDHAAKYDLAGLVTGTGLLAK